MPAENVAALIFTIVAILCVLVVVFCGLNEYYIVTLYDGTTLTIPEYTYKGDCLRYSDKQGTHFIPLVSIEKIERKNYLKHEKQ